MNTYFLTLIFTSIIIFYQSFTSACPCEFSPHDTRPFFEQYEEKEHDEKKEEKKEKPCAE